ncbi:MAG TPA: hypothetical protein VJI98_04765 [Candidatus Nanoarchaeia archaeon]|nr:hypothetical protein [Candidatus Nanoarchaeia archaeon]
MLHVVKRNERCPMIGINPDTADYDKRILGGVVKKHDQKIGIYAIVRKTGVVRFGDPVILY